MGRGRGDSPKAFTAVLPLIGRRITRTGHHYAVSVNRVTCGLSGFAEGHGLHLRESHVFTCALHGRQADVGTQLPERCGLLGKLLAGTGASLAQEGVRSGAPDPRPSSAAGSPVSQHSPPELAPRVGLLQPQLLASSWVHLLSGSSQEKGEGQRPGAPSWSTHSPLPAVEPACPGRPLPYPRPRAPKLCTLPRLSLDHAMGTAVHGPPKCLSPNKRAYEKPRAFLEVERHPIVCGL